LTTNIRGVTVTPFYLHYYTCPCWRYTTSAGQCCKLTYSC